MAEHFSFFDPVIQIDGTYDREYNAQQFTNYFKTLVTTGVLKGERNQLKLTATGTTMQTKVDTGVAYILGRYYENDSLKELTHDTESLGVSRIDRVVIRMDLSTEARYVKSFIKKGAPSPNPVPPTLTQTQTVYEISLAQVRVIGGQTFIAADAVTDERGTNVICPWAGSNILPNFDDSALEELIAKVDNSWQKGVYNNTNIINIGANRATRVFPQVNWKETGIELWETSFSLPKSVWGILELDIAGFSASTGAKIVIEVGISVPSSGSSTLYKNQLKVITATTEFTENFYVEFEHRQDVRGAYIKVYKRTYNDAINVVATFTSMSNSATLSAFDFLKGFHEGWLFNNIASVPASRQKDFDTRIKENFTLVSNGKATVNQAVTDMGVYTAPDAPFATTAANIRNLSNIKAGTGTITSDNLRTTFAVSGLPFKPRAIMLQARNANIQAKGMYNEQFTASEFLILINGNGMNNTFSVFQGGFNVSAAYPNGTGLFDYWAIK